MYRSLRFFIRTVFSDKYATVSVLFSTCSATSEFASQHLASNKQKPVREITIFLKCCSMAQPLSEAGNGMRI